MIWTKICKPEDLPEKEKKVFFIDIDNDFHCGFLTDFGWYLEGFAGNTAGFYEYEEVTHWIFCDRI